MRAVGARRRQIALVYVKTALLLGAHRARSWESRSGSCSRTCSPRYFGSTFFAIDVGLGVDPTVLLLQRRWSGCGAAGAVLLPRSAAASASTSARRSSPPAPRSGARTLPTACSGGRASCRGRCRSACAASGGASGAALRRRWIVALAVANLLASLALAAAATESSRASGGAITSRTVQDLDGRASAVRRARGSRVIRSTPGVAQAQPVLKNTVELAGREAFVWGVPREPLFRYRPGPTGAGSAPPRSRRGQRVAVIERNIAEDRRR